MDLIPAVIGILVSGGIIVTWYYLFWKPFYWYRDLTELGFDEVNRSKRHNDISKEEQINELRHKRKVGELPPVYPNGWYAILESDELPLNGVKEVCVLGLNLVAWRGNTGKTYVADAYCPHLGAHLGIGGKVSGECIACPFHGWKFHGFNGALTDIPYSDANFLVGSKSVKINIQTTMKMNNYIYLWYHAEGEEPTWFPEVIPEIESKELIYRGSNHIKVESHIQDIFENGADLVHLKTVHSPSILCGSEPEASLFTWDFLKHDISGDWQAKKHVSYMKVTTNLCLFNKFRIVPIHPRVKQVGPGIIIFKGDTFLGPVVIIHTVKPVAPLIQKISHKLYSARTFIQPIAKLFLLGDSIMIERDIRIWNRKTHFKNPILTIEDKTIQSFRRWFSQFY